MTVEDRLAHLESTIAFQDRTIASLSETLYRQQEQIDLLTARVRDLARRQAPLVRDAADEEPPPHY